MKYIIIIPPYAKGHLKILPQAVRYILGIDLWIFGYYQFSERRKSDI